MTPDPYGDAFDESVDEFMEASQDPMDREISSEVLGGYVVNWRTLEDPEAIAEAWRELRDWVEWFSTRYDIPSSLIPDCWWRHGALVEELSALHSAHKASFDPSDTGYGPASWHERLTLARARFSTAYKSGCTNGHVDPRPREFPDDDEAWTRWIRSTHA